MSTCEKSPTRHHQFNWPAGWQWWSREGWCYYCGDTSKEDGRDASPKSVTTEETNNHQGVDSMSNTTAPATIPPGFRPSDLVADIPDMADIDDMYEGKRMDGARWTIRSEWAATTGKFTLTCWTTDDDPMTAAEVQEYSAALLEMSSYIATLEWAMNTGVESGQ